MNWDKIKPVLREVKLNIEVCIEMVALSVMLLFLGIYSIIIICCTFIFEWLDQCVQFMLKMLHLKK